VRFLLVFLVVLVVAWRWRTWRESAQIDKKKANNSSAASANMVPCRLCGLHVPLNEVEVGTLGNYCSKDHRLKLEP
jgi:hypothetical protein